MPSLDPMRAILSQACCSIPQSVIVPNAMAICGSVRAVFFIDPDHKIRLIMYYPLNVGRNMDEIIRALKALQFSDKNKVAIPLNWQPGDKVIVPPPKTLAEMDARIADNSIEKIDFYLAKKQL